MKSKATVERNWLGVPLQDSFTFEPRTGIVKVSQTIRSNFYVYRMEHKYLAWVKLHVDEESSLTDLGLDYPNSFLSLVCERDLGGGNTPDHLDGYGSLIRSSKE